MICERCGVEFTPQNSEPVCASCVGKALQAQRKRETVKCKNCGEEFIRVVRKNPSQYCRRCQNRPSVRKLRKPPK